MREIPDPARSGRLLQTGQDRPAAPASQAEDIAPSVVIAEEEAYEGGLLLLAVQAVPDVTIISKPPADVQSECGERGKRHPKAHAVATQQCSIEASGKCGFPDVDEQPRLNLR